MGDHVPAAAAGSFWPHLAVLVRKNVLLKRRHPVPFALEVLLPIAFAGIMLAVFSLFDTVVQPVTPHTAWGQDIQRVSPFHQTAHLLLKQRKRLAVIPASPDLRPVVARLVEDLSAVYPAFDGSTAGGPYTNGFNDSILRAVRLPGFADVVTTSFESEQDLVDWIRSPGYPGPDPFALRGRVWAAIIVESAPPHPRFSIRMNASEVPPTSGALVDVLQKEHRPWQMQQYLFATPFVADSSSLFGGGDWNSADFNDLTRRSVPGFLTLQLMLDRWLINTTLPPESWTFNDYSGRIGSAFWTELGQENGGLIWNEVWGSPPDGDWQRKEEWRANISADMARYSRGELYFPQGVDVAPFPTPGYKENGFFSVLQFSMPLNFVLAFLFPASRLISGLVGEKETKLREGLRMMGANTAAVHASWILIYGAQYLVSAIVVAAMLVGSGVFASSGFGPIFLLFLLFGAATISFAAFVSVFFSKARTASTLGTLIYLVSYFPFYGVGTSDSGVGRGGKLGACVLPPTAFAVTLAHVMALEGSGSGVRLSGPDANATVLLRGFAYVDGIALLAGSAVLFALLAAYADAVLPFPLREFGTPLPWYFPCSPRYWGCKTTAGHRARPDAGGGASAGGMMGHGPLTSSAPSSDDPAKLIAGGSDDAVHINPIHGGGAGPVRGGSSSSFSMSGFVEPPDSHLLAKEAAGRCVRIEGLRKTFTTPDGTLKHAVDGVDLTMYEGQIFVLLGHNGAGKSTLINVLTGLTPASGGTASVFGRDLGTDLTAIRRTLGVCPQHDVLWPELTALEHLRIFAAVKGVEGSSRADLDASLLSALRDVGLEDKADAQTRTLSGGQKRKLSVAIALLGKSEVVLLDEPTSGMDPFSRRATWQLLLRERAGRVLLLTTHFLDEADALGERVAILSHGKVHSCGSPMYLKHAFGVGVTLTLERAEGGGGESSPPLADTAPLFPLLDDVRRFVPDAQPASSTENQLTIRLPLQASRAFPAMLASLERFVLPVVAANDDGGAVNPTPAPRALLGAGPHLLPLGISVTTMEDVFLRVAQLVDGNAMVPPPSTSTPSASASPSLTVPVGPNAPPPPRRTAGCCRLFVALFRKRLLYARRDLRSVCMQLVVPIALIVAGFGLLKLGNRGDLPPLLLRPHWNLRDAADQSSATLYPNRVPVFSNFKSAEWPLESADVGVIADALGWTDAAGSTAPLASQFADEGGRLKISLAQSQAVPDPYGIRGPRSDGDEQSGWPGLAFSAMSAWLVAEKEDSLGEGLTAGTWPGGGAAARATRDGGSLYGAVVFTANGSVMRRQDLRASFFASVDRQNESLPAFLPSAPLDVSRNVDPAPPSPALTYGVLVNTTAVHSMPVFVNLVNDALYRLKIASDILGPTSNTSERLRLARQGAPGASSSASSPSIASITVLAHPLPYTIREAVATSSIFSYGAACIAAMAFAFLPATFASFVVKERETGSKHLQRLSGVSATAYWAASYAFDVTTYLLPASATIVAAVGFGIKEFADPGQSRLASFVALFALYGLAVAPFSYVLSFLFRTSGSAQTGVLLLSVLSVILMMVTLVLRQVTETCVEESAIRLVFLLLPGFGLGNGLMTLAFLPSLPALDANCRVSRGLGGDSGDASLKYDALDLRATGWNIIFLAVEAVVYFILAVAIDAGEESPRVRAWRVARSSRAQKGAQGGASVADAPAEASPATSSSDPDVAAEVRRVEGLAHHGVSGGGSGGEVAAVGSTGAPSVVLYHLRKVYPPQQGGGGRFCGRFAATVCCCCPCARRGAHRPRHTGKSADDGMGVASTSSSSSSSAVPSAVPSAASSSAASSSEDLSRPKVAVKDLSFALQPGEVFGFLGVNGAGKTTALQVLSGDTLPTAGTASMGGHDIVTEQAALRHLLGYCPQFDALHDLLTVREHLELYARIKGVSEADLPSVVGELLTRMDLATQQGVLAGTLSGGNKRKTSVAIALISAPPIIFLDEPSTGMDPVAKRFMWRVISGVATERKQCSIILTTHSMEEVEALCTRIGIMVSGELRCLGTAQHLKRAHGQGFQLQLQLRAPTDGEVDAVRGAAALALATLRGGADPAGARIDGDTAISRSEAEGLLSRLGAGRAHLVGELRDGGSGWALHLALGGAAGAASAAAPTSASGPASAGGAGGGGGAPATVPLDRLCAWVAEEDLSGAVVRFFCGSGGEATGAGAHAKAPAPPAFFRGGQLIERHGTSLRIRLPASRGVPLSAVFGAIEEARDGLGIVSSALGETSLEQVFNEIASGEAGAGGTKQQRAAATARAVVAVGGRTAAPVGRGWGRKGVASD
jgi:ABC-type multidrug transport system ATPase subunit